jgi:putative radical SAM-modified peptide
MELEVLDEGLENVELVNACCAGGTGNARK